MKKLTLNKETIATLNSETMNILKGGDTTPAGSNAITCTECPTDITLCKTPTCVLTQCAQNTCAVTCACQ